MKPKLKTKSPKKTTKETITRVRNLAWVGQYDQAIELATQALSEKKLNPKLQMDLLDMRAESYFANGRFDLSARDAAAMTKLAIAEKSPALKTQAQPNFTQ